MIRPKVRDKVGAIWTSLRIWPCAAFLVAGWMTSSSGFADAAAPVLLSGSAAVRAWENPSLVEIRESTLGEVLQTLTSDRQLGLIRDRRTDPEQTVQFAPKVASLGVVLAGLLPPDETALFVEQTVYVGPVHSTRRLEALVFLHRQQVQKRKTAGSAASVWLAKKTWSWPELSNPRDIVTGICESLGTRCVNPEALPHDLFERPQLPPLDGAVILAFLLSQFDLMFELSPDGTDLKVVPIPTELWLEKSYGFRQPPREVTAAREESQRRFPGTVWRLAGEQSSSGKRDWAIRATVDGHAWITEQLPERTGATKPKPQGPLAKQSFQLTLKGTTIRNVMDDLEQLDIRFEYDEAAFQTAGVDFDQAFSLEEKSITGAELIRRLVAPLRVEHRLEGRVVKLQLPRR